MKNLKSWLNYLETLHPKAMDLGLSRVSKIANALKLLPFKNFIITVAGTNGKGSCVALLDVTLRAAGYTTATYTSPHLLHYNERICINGNKVSDARLCEAFAEIEKVRGNITLTYFEFGTLAALLLFKQTQPDVVILEVGMGGRLDAVNIVDADLAIISTIALDHMEWLGHDREAIGYEKAGIMRSGKPCVSGDTETPNSIVSQAKVLHVPLYCQAKDFGYHKSVTDWTWWSQTQTLAHLVFPKIELQNAATVLKALEMLPTGLKVSVGAIQKGLTEVNIPGRFQVIPGKVVTILDVAHNPAAGKLLAKNLQTHVCNGRTFAVVAMLADKDMHATLKPLLSQIDAWYVSGLNVARGGQAELLASELQQLVAQQISMYSSVSQAYQQALHDAEIGDRIVVFGSFYTVAEVLRLGL